MSQQFEEFEELWTRFLEGELDECGMASLQQLLSSDRELLRQAASLYEEHRLLGFVLQSFDDSQFCDDIVSRLQGDSCRFVDEVISELRRSTAGSPVSTPRRTTSPVPTGPFPGRTLAGPVAGLVLLLVAVLGFWSLRNTDVRDRKEDQSQAGFARSAFVTVLLEQDCQWSTGGPGGEGRRLDSDTIELTTGTAVLRFDGGAELVITGPATLDLLSADSVRLRLGDIVVRATEGAEGFVVTTPTSEVVDLGTEFAVKVARTGATEVHVLEGEVSYRQLDAPADLVKILRAGEGIWIDRSGRPVAVPMNSPRFREYVQRINPRSRTDLLLAYEGFNYSPGLLPLEKSTVGIGWAGPWRRRRAAEQTVPESDQSPDHLEIVHGRLNVTWPVPGGRMGMLRLPPHDVYYVRPLKQPIRLDQDGVTYFSMMVRETERPVRSAAHRERVRVTFRSLKQYYSDYISFGHGSGYRPRVRTGDGALHTSPLLMPAEQTTLWIGKIVSQAQGDDTICFRVYGEDDVLGYAEPATWHVMTHHVTLDAHLDCILLSSEGRTSRLVDELRIGPTWRSVAPMQEDDR